MRSLRKILLLIGTLSIFLILTYKEFEVVNSIEATTPGRPQRNRTKRILYWGYPPTREEFNGTFGSEIFQNCIYDNCELTTDKEAIPVEDFDAIIFQFTQNPEKEFTKPKKRKANQVYIFATRISPAYTSPLYREHNHFFNWTMTYRHDSDIYWPYGYLQEAKTGYQAPLVRDILNRKKKVAWVASRCNVHSHREDVFNRIDRHAQIELFGECGNQNCNSKKEDCFAMIESNFKFYLSFEDSVCADYVTRELFDILKYDVVPVVYGGLNYYSVMPFPSVIDVMRFQFADDLVAFLKFLDWNPKEYLRYFQWKEEFVVVTDDQKTFCELCRKLNRPIRTKIYEDMAMWWTGKGFDKCSNSFVKRFL